MLAKQFRSSMAQRAAIWAGMLATIATLFIASIIQHTYKLQTSVAELRTTAVQT